ncbi:hypothetical protein [Microbacterium azadirachtae]|uniref:Uncharacterized protein n=1 Tax=Microbacterium azadirachtae TaxID=582680 RepID=A0A0F0LFJ4_9MICO|nr:hypothetical protein [Microbacterium azadirachtae]KJL31903.1 hypothetical protein RS86_03184 [Microbacterium azadirachtae]
MTDQPAPPSHATGGFLADADPIDHVWQQSSDLPSSIHGARLLYGEDVIPYRNPNH